MSVDRPGVHFTWSELGSPPDDVRPALRALVAAVLDPLRVCLGRPLHVTSAWRSWEKNAQLGGSSRSQHPAGEAADVWAAGYSARSLALLVRQLRLPVDQVIWYSPERGGHLHVSHVRPESGRRNRGDWRHAPLWGGYPPWTP